MRRLIAVICCYFAIAAPLCAQESPVPSISGFTEMPGVSLTVEYGQSRLRMIAAAHYGENVNVQVASDGIFPGSGMMGKRTVHFALFQFLETPADTSVIMLMSKSGYRPANIDELLTYVRDLKDPQVRKIIIALMSEQRIGDKPPLHWFAAAHINEQDKKSKKWRRSLGYVQVTDRKFGPDEFFLGVKKIEIIP